MRSRSVLPQRGHRTPSPLASGRWPSVGGFGGRDSGMADASLITHRPPAKAGQLQSPHGRQTPDCRRGPWRRRKWRQHRDFLSGCRLERGGGPWSRQPAPADGHSSTRNRHNVQGNRSAQPFLQDRRPAGLADVFHDQDSGLPFAPRALWLLGFRCRKLSLSDPDEIRYPLSVV